MKSGFFGAIALVLIGAGWAAAQAPAPGSFPPAASLAPYPAFSGPPTEASSLPAEASLPAAGGPVLYGNADFLMWRIRGGNIASGTSVAPVGLISAPINNLVTSPAGATTISPSGVATILPVSISNNVSFGTGDRADYGTTLGGRFALGFWCDPEMTWGLEAVGTVLERAIDHFSAVQGATPNQFLLNVGSNNLFLTSPFGLVPNGTVPVVVPRASVTSLVGDTSTSLYGGEINARCVGLRFGCVDVGGVLGFHYLSLREDLDLYNNSNIFLPTGFSDPAGSKFSRNLNFSTVDQIRTLNNFYGGQAGLDIDAKFGSFFVYARGTVGLGDMHQEANITGSTIVVNNDPTHPTPPSSTFGGGLLSGPGDSGSHFRDHLAFLPELNLKVGYQVCSWLRAYVGYDAMTINDVARAGGVTTTNSLNSTVSVGGTTNNVNIAQPAFRFQDQHVFVQGANFGVEIQY